VGDLNYLHGGVVDEENRALERNHGAVHRLLQGVWPLSVHPTPAHMCVSLCVSLYREKERERESEKERERVCVYALTPATPARERGREGGMRERGRERERDYKEQRSITGVQGCKQRFSLQKSTHRQTTHAHVHRAETPSPNRKPQTDIRHTPTFTATLSLSHTPGRKVVQVLEQQNPLHWCRH